MDPIRAGIYSKLADHVIKQLQKRRMAGSFAPTGKDALNMVVSMIPEGSSIYRCGSMTLVELGIIDALYAIPGVTIYDSYREGLTREESMEQRRQGLLADFMVTSSNALTVDGQLVNLDGMGNRVAGMIFGPKKVILVVGMNKIVKDVEEAKSRVKHHAAPMNSFRLNLDNPCRETLLCSDCKSPTRICNVWSIIQGHMIKDRIHVVLVGENAGY